MRKLAGRPSKPSNKKVVRKNTSYSRNNYNYILEIINKKKLDVKGNYSKEVNEIISDHRKVKRFKDIEAGKLKEKLEALES